MQNPRLASRYAKSLTGLAIEKNQLETVYADMLWLQAVCKGSREFTNMLRSPIIKADTKKKIVAAVTAEKTGELTTAFINLLVTKSRESFLPEIITAFISSYKAHENIYSLKLTTAAPVTDATRQAIVNQVKKSAGIENIELEESVNEDLIGGFVLQLGDKLIDASIRYDLKTIARQFENNDFIYKIR